ncbi:MAG: methyltransferase [Acidimicrobiales bacterium]|nr:methyltransferase [Acidimicrobiales bacterium]
MTSSPNGARGLQVQVDAIDHEIAADRLWQLGANAVVAYPDHLHAGFDTLEQAQRARAQLPWPATVDPPADPAAWYEAWKPHAPIVELERLVIHPPWKDPPPLDGRRSISIDPGLAFGHGAHPTTRLLLEALEHQVQPGDRVLDVGCGSGVLALAAAALGAASVLAIDIDPIAVAQTRQNAAANQFDVIAASTPIESLPGSYDLVVVNMIQSELGAVAADLLRLTGRALLVSGLLTGQTVRTLPELVTIAERDGWQACHADR